TDGVQPLIPSLDRIHSPRSSVISHRRHDQSLPFVFCFSTFAHSQSHTTASLRQTTLVRFNSHSPTTPSPRCLPGAKPRLSQRPLLRSHFNSPNKTCQLGRPLRTASLGPPVNSRSLRVFQERRPYHTLSNLVAMSAAPTGTLNMNEYTFPTERLQSQLRDPSRTPLVLVACGSFSPITFLHLRMFEMAADYARFNTNFEVVGAYISAVGDAYKKSGLVKAEHRINMCSLAVEQSSWISVDPWEALHEDYLETAKVLDHFEHEINTTRGPFNTPQGPKKAKIALLAGADLIQTMSAPGVWAPKDIDYILSNFGAFIIERAGTDIDEALSTLQQWKDNIHVVQQLVQNDISSTKIRLFRKRDMSIRYLVPEPVVKYIEEQGLYDEDGANSTHEAQNSKKPGESAGAPPQNM
ncbi:Nucleotidylyl transferase, partial [Aureobasidium pullulans]